MFEKAGIRTLAGQCMCGAIRYTVADEFAYAELPQLELQARHRLGLQALRGHRAAQAGH
jgi:hypothetical protein